ncbi:hypothetical protein [Catenulispora subtropica]|uniref:Lipoprotein n=1 Tax=Catenulispora subtropica TaxID=450798 RepID=A0ABN2RPU6_9ACTN
MRRRWQTAAVPAAVVALTAGACGVQPTGVNVASTPLFSVSHTSDSPPASSAGGNEKVTLFLVPRDNASVYRVTRFVAKKPRQAPDLLQYLSTVTEDEQASNLDTSVPPDVELMATDSAHEFVVLNPPKLGSVALKQMACTFDAFWRQQQPYDGQKYSTQFIFPSGSKYDWDDCPSVFQDNSPGPTAPPARGTKPVGSPSPFGN